MSAITRIGERILVPKKKNDSPIEIALYVDGSCVNNGKPNSSMGCGIRAVYVTLGTVKEYHRSLGEGTNNLAELCAIEEGLKIIKQSVRHRSDVTIYSDSQYAINVCSNNYRARANREKVAEIKLLMREFNSVTFKWIKAHNEHVGNTAADSLARKGSKASKAEVKDWVDWFKDIEEDAND